MWTSSLSKGGYGGFSLNGKTIFAHRASWILNKGKIPKGLHVCHKCDRPACVNPEHLFLGTHTENMIDMIRKGRHGYSVLSKEKVKEIKRMYTEGEKQVSIAKKFNVSRQLIWSIIHKRHENI